MYFAFRTILTEIHRKGSVTMCGDNIEGALTGMCLEDYGYDEVIYLSDDRFLPALVGVTTDNRAVYDYGKIIEILQTEFRLSEQDAVEHADYNFSGVMGGGVPNIYLRGGRHGVLQGCHGKGREYANVRGSRAASRTTILRSGTRAALCRLFFVFRHNRHPEHIKK